MRVGLSIRTRLGCGAGIIFYWFAPNSSAWIDVLGLASIFEKLKITTSDGFLFKGFTVKAPLTYLYRDLEICILIHVVEIFGGYV